MRLRISGKLALVVVVAALAVVWLLTGVSGRPVYVGGPFPGPRSCPFCGVRAPGPLARHRQECGAHACRCSLTVHSPQRRGGRIGAQQGEPVSEYVRSVRGGRLRRRERGIRQGSSYTEGRLQYHGDLTEHQVRPRNSTGKRSAHSARFSGVGRLHCTRATHVAQPRFAMRKGELRRWGSTSGHSR